MKLSCEKCRRSKSFELYSVPSSSDSLAQEPMNV